jgi:hypothetical protein
MVGSTFLLICRIEHEDTAHIPFYLRKPLDEIKAVWSQFSDISVTTDDSIAATSIQVIPVASFFRRMKPSLRHRRGFFYLPQLSLPV